MRTRKPLGVYRPQRQVIARGSTRARRLGGYTLIETLVALGVLGFALAGLAMLMVGNVQTGWEARRLTAAGALAQQKIEDLRALGYTNAIGSVSEEVLAETGATTGVIPFHRTWTVTGVDPNPKDVTVTVAWTDALGSHQVQLQSKMAK
jgi:type II secretory pathway pseudopilin PulG